ncbi:MAG: hypothetical protein WC505_01945 [Patescibacteria group bacterium]
MTKNPFLNALAAGAYIVLVVGIMTYMGKLNGGQDQEFITPLAVLSLFTLSAAVMGYLFLYQPFKLYFNNEKEAAVKLFLKTVAIFGVMTACILVVVAVA